MSYNNEPTIELELGSLETFTRLETGETFEGRFACFGDSPLVTRCGKELWFKAGEKLRSETDHGRTYTVQEGGTACIYKNNQPFVYLTPTDCPQPGDEGQPETFGRDLR